MNNRHSLRDKYGRLLGIIYKEENILILTDRFGKRLGTYHISSDETRDRFGKVVARGNWLSALLYKEVQNLVDF